MDVISETTQTAQKPHGCNYCGQRIEKGDMYKRQFITDGHGAWSWKSHERCDKLAKALNMFDDLNGEGLTGDDFQEHVYNAYS